MTTTQEPPASAPSTSRQSAVGPFEWALLVALVVIGGSSFAMIRAAVETIPPAAVAVGRLWVGAFTTLAIMALRGATLPPLTKGARLSSEWLSMAGFGIVGYALPFSIFPWAQQFVPSGLAGVYMAFMPLWTLGLAYLFADETLSREKLTGFALGLVGVGLLMGPEAFAGARDASVTAQAAILLATVFYAASAVITRRAPAMRPMAFAAGSLLIGALAATPTVLLAPLETANWSLASLASVLGLGLFPTGLAALMIVTLIRRAGAGFMALTNYLTPFWAVAMGAFFFAERLAPSAFVALAVILVGVVISQRPSPAVE